MRGIVVLLETSLGTHCVTLCATCEAADAPTRLTAAAVKAMVEAHQWHRSEAYVGKPQAEWSEADWRRVMARSRAEAAYATHVIDQMRAVEAERRACGCEAVNVPFNPDGTRDFARARVAHTCGRQA